MGTENFSLYEQWFRLADEDNDGKVGGAEAVKFFKRSELPQPVLAQVWQIASAGAAALSKPQFSAAMQLVSLAQQSGGNINPQTARQIMVGLGPKLPPPRMAGLSSGAQQQPQGAFPASGATGGYFNQPNSAPFPASGATGSFGRPQPGGWQPSGPTGGGWHSSGPTGGLYQPSGPTGGGWQPSGPTGGLYQPSGPTGGGWQPSGPTGGGGGSGLPVMTDAEERQYVAVYERLDTQRSGAVQGGAVFPVFSSSGLPRETLGRIWSLVAGNRGSLSRQEFVTAHYLLDCARRGLPLPAAIPSSPGAFPPRQAPPGQPSLPQQQPQQHQQAHPHQQAPNEDAISAVNDAFASLGASLGVPQHLISGPSSAAPPPPPSYMGPTEDMQAYGVTDPADLPHRKKAFFEHSLQEVTLYRRRVEGQLLQLEGSARTVQEAAQLEADYKKLHAAATEAAEGASALEAQIEEAMEHKEEAQRRFDELNQQKHHLSNVRAEDVVRDEGAAEETQRQAEAAEARVAELRDMLGGGEAQKASLVEKLRAFEGRRAVAEAREAETRRELDGIQRRLEGEGAGAGAAWQLGDALRKVVALHAGLLQEMADSGAAPPAMGEDASANKAGLQWRMDAVATARDVGSAAAAAGAPYRATAVPPTASEFSKGEAVWYVKHGQRTEGTVVSVDRSIKPPSYVVKLANGERETEGCNLQPRPAPATTDEAFAAQPPPPFAALDRSVPLALF